ncbi:hypothetical protein ACLI4Y_00760 [Natrialbaceae archaeon A-CW3]
MYTDRLQQFCRHTRTRFEQSPPSTLLETRSIVDHLLRTLGWDIYEHCQTNVNLQGTTLEYVCTIDDVPALFVAVEDASSDLSTERVTDLRALLGTTGVDRAIYTNGQAALLLAGTASVDAHRCNLREPNTLEPLSAHYTRRALSQRLRRHSRPVVARKLAVERETVRTAMVEALTDVTGDAYARELEVASDRFVDSLVASFTGGTGEASEANEMGDPPSTVTQPSPADNPFRPSTDQTDAEADEPTQQIDDSAREESSNAVHYTDRTLEDSEISRRSATEGTETGDDEEGPAETGETPARADDRASDSASDEDGDHGHDEDGEYVVRFFSDQGSIGAIGHSTTTGALVHATEFLFERGLSGVRLPWPDAESEAGAESAGDVSRADDPVLVGRDETHTLERCQQLSNGIHLNTAGAVEEHVDRIEALGSRAGYRVMLTGDWEEER